MSALDEERFIFSSIPTKVMLEIFMHLWNTFIKFKLRILRPTSNTKIMTSQQPNIAQEGGTMNNNNSSYNNNKPGPTQQSHFQENTSFYIRGYSVFNNVASTIMSHIPNFRWLPTSKEELEEIEASILSCIKRPFKTYFVDIGPGWKKVENKINTFEMLTNQEILKQEKNCDPKEPKCPLVMIHGFAAGIGVWILNMDELALSLDRKIYAFDILGFARSSRTKFDLKGDVEGQFVESIERWRLAMKIDKFVLLGHSFGGYLIANYALKHPKKVSHIILADPWGVQDVQERSDKAHYRLPIHVRTANFVLQRFNPLSILRVTGPYGPSLINTFRNDLKEKFVSKLKEDSPKFLEYLYHCNVQSPTGETAFKSLTLPYGWAKRPIVHRLLDLDPSIGVTFIYGSRSWIDRSPGEYVKEKLGAHRVGYHIIHGSGHHVYADKFNDFNDIIKDVCNNKVLE